MIVLSQELVEKNDVLNDLKLMQETNCLGLLLSFANRENYYKSLIPLYLFDNYYY